MAATQGSHSNPYGLSSNENLHAVLSAARCNAWAAYAIIGRIKRIVGTYKRSDAVLLKRLSPGQWLCLGIAAVLVALSFVFYQTDVVSTESTAALIGAHKTGIGMLTEDSPAAQTFRAAQSGLNAVDVMVSTYNKKLKEGTLTLWLLDESGREVARKDYPVSELKNNAFVTLPLAQRDGQSEGKTYTLHAASTCTEQKGLTLRMGPVGEGSDAITLTLADGTEDTENALSLRCRFVQPVYGSMALATTLLIALCFAACVPMAHRKEQSHE